MPEVYRFSFLISSCILSLENRHTSVLTMVLCLKMDKRLGQPAKGVRLRERTGSDDRMTNSLAPQLVSDSLLSSKLTCPLFLTCTSLFTQGSITDIIATSMRALIMKSECAS